MKEEIIRVMVTLKRNRQMTRRGILPWQVAIELPQQYTYCDTYVRRIMKRMADEGLLIRVGYRSGYLVP